MAIVALTTQDKLSGTQTGTNDLTTPTETYALSTSVDYTSGTGTNQMTKVWQDTRTITASNTENLDLAGGLTDSFGNVLTFTAIKYIRVTALSTNTNNVVLGGAAANTFVGMFDDATDKIRVKPGGRFVWEAPGTGATVTAGTGDILLVANSGAGTSVVYDIVIGGLA